jgi:peptide/nickel transport system ATP-binding protein
VTEPTTASFLEVENLTVAYRQGGIERKALRNISLTLQIGKVYGLVGESGSGKTTLALAIMRYLPPQAVIRQGKIQFNDRNLLEMSADEMRQIWGKDMTYIPQDPESSLNPSIKIGEQIAEGMRIHQGLTKVEAQEATLDWIEKVRLSDPVRVSRSYPHQISGGMQQRVLIAMALSAKPKLLVLDEPTTNLDVTTQASVLNLLQELLAAGGMTALYVTHNLGVVGQFCDHVSVLYAGELVERGPKGSVYDRPLHPYTSGLLHSVPDPGENKGDQPLKFMPGRAPKLTDFRSGCAFRTRCPIAIDVCEQHPSLFPVSDSRASRCHRWQELMQEELTIDWSVDSIEEISKKTGETEPALSLENLTVIYPKRRSIGQLLSGDLSTAVEAVSGIDLDIPRGRTLGLVGESGSGKTTLARAVVGLVAVEDGETRFMGRVLPRQLNRRDIDTIRQIQMVFQNPHEALNPYLTIGETLRRPLQRHLGVSRDQAQTELVKLLDSVQLSPEFVQRFPGQLSGGEKQRVAIARAFASNPALLVADEPVSSLDVSVQAAILNLLNTLQRKFGGTYLFISHNLAVVGYFADVIAVIYLGRLMQVADAVDLFSPPYHPYTEALLAAIPTIKDGPRVERVLLEGDIPRVSEVTSGCPFHSRCPRSLGDLCRDHVPPWQVTETGKRYFCHIDESDLLLAQSSVWQDRKEREK